VAKRDHQLTDFDLPGFLAILREAIHGAQPPTPASLTAWRQTAALPCPFQVVAIQFGDGAPPCLPPKHPPATLLQIHPGLAYLCCVTLPAFQRTLAPNRLLVGESHIVTDEHGLIRAIQNALLSLRRRELAAVQRRRGATPAFGAEVEARHVALDRIRSGQPWDEALTVWSDIVLCRHSNSLHTIRRKMVELLSLLTRDIDRNLDIALAVRIGVARIYDTFALTALATTFRQVIDALVPLLAQTSTATPSDPLIRRAVALLHERHTGSISLRTVARQLSVSPAHLSRRFSATMRTTLTAHLTDLRLATAREHLSDSNDGILAIALASGFGSLEHFHRTFRRVLGTTPSAWRKAHHAS